MVRLAGIEPTTPWFVAKYSIQLSYSRSFQRYGGEGVRQNSVRSGSWWFELYLILNNIFEILVHRSSRDFVSSR